MSSREVQIKTHRTTIAAMGFAGIDASRRRLIPAFGLLAYLKPLLMSFMRSELEKPKRGTHWKFG